MLQHFPLSSPVHTITITWLSFWIFYFCCNLKTTRLTHFKEVKVYLSSSSRVPPWQLNWGNYLSYFFPVTPLYYLYNLPRKESRIIDQYGVIKHFKKQPMLVKKSRAVMGWLKSMASTLNSKKTGELLSYFFSVLIRNRHRPTDRHTPTDKIAGRFYDSKEGILWLHLSPFYFQGALQDVSKNCFRD
jgi:hypothetical protein